MVAARAAPAIPTPPPPRGAARKRSGAVPSSVSASPSASPTSPSSPTAAVNAPPSPPAQDVVADDVQGDASANVLGVGDGALGEQEGDDVGGRLFGCHVQRRFVQSVKDVDLEQRECGRECGWENGRGVAGKGNNRLERGMRSAS
jgi:hypothetical protein